MQPIPGCDAITGSQTTELARQVSHMRTYLAALPRARLMPRVDAISRGVL